MPNPAPRRPLTRLAVVSLVCLVLCLTAPPLAWAGLVVVATALALDLLPQPALGPGPATVDLAEPGLHGIYAPAEHSAEGAAGGSPARLRVRPMGGGEHLEVTAPRRVRTLRWGASTYTAIGEVEVPTPGSYVLEWNGVDEGAAAFPLLVAPTLDWGEELRALVPGLGQPDPPTSPPHNDPRPPGDFSSTPPPAELRWL